MPRPARLHWDDPFQGSDYSDDEREFIIAMERYRRVRRRPFPTCREVLQVIESLGYRKTPHPNPLPQGEREQECLP